ncbi:MAG: 50S ribosomal protein L3, partial [Planctomycetales bacterium]
GKAYPVTVIQTGPCVVLQLRTEGRDGYEAVQLGFLDKPRRLAGRGERGHFAELDSKRSRKRKAAGVEIPAKPDCEPKRFIREFRVPVEGYEIGQELTVEQVFAEITKVDVTGISKGRGTAGVMKRHNFSGQRASHGVKKVHRHMGSVGWAASPSRIFKGRKMPGRYGAAQTTVRNLEVVQIDQENHLLVICGAIPGPNGGMVTIRPTNKK